ncbi:MAG: hypothetical protein ACW99A_16905 [Candidatus Kariarchaeaceae archaeon]
MQEKSFREGPVGALMDEHERALNELIELSSNFTQEQFVRIVDFETEDENCRSIQTVLNHVMKAGYAYSNYIRDKFNNLITSNPIDIQNISENANSQLNMFDYMLETMEDKYGFSEKDMAGHIINTRWGANLDIETLLEHAVVHLLRHRRQLEKFNQLYFYK